MSLEQEFEDAMHGRPVGERLHCMCDEDLLRTLLLATSRVEPEILGTSIRAALVEAWNRFADQPERFYAASGVAFDTWDTLEWTETITHRSVEYVLQGTDVEDEDEA